MQKPNTSTLKARAMVLRQSGHLYSEIAKELGVAKSTAYMWTRSVPLDQQQQAVIAGKLYQKQRRLVAKMAAVKRAETKRRNEAMRKTASDIVGSAAMGQDHKRVLCAVMFWCEGGKDVAAGIQFINSDPVMMGTFLTLLRESFPVDENKFHAIIHLHDYHNPVKQLDFWSEVTRIPKEKFYKPYIKPHTGKNKRDGYPGCVSVRYHDSGLGKLLKMVYSEFGTKTINT